jgi:hypothetical protein
MGAISGQYAIITLLAVAPGVCASSHGADVARYVRERAGGSNCTWQATELLGPCPGGAHMRPSRPPEASASACEAACCRSAVCVSWQYRDGDGRRPATTPGGFRPGPR